MELKNIISETLSEIEKMAKTIDDGFNVVQKTPSFFKTPPNLPNTPDPKNANAPLEPKNATKIETQEKIAEEKEEEAPEIITEETTPKYPKHTTHILSHRPSNKNKHATTKNTLITII
ncbi:hypothetical protein VN0416_08620 [Helicobacter pylori]